MREESDFDAAIVGSGFGGSVMALRLAEAGLRVCLLERGKPYPPGSFPRSPRGVSQNFWDPSEGLYGMFNAWTFRGLEALVSSGLGGGSLIYANVLIRKDEKWFVDEDSVTGAYRPWPVSRAELEPHYSEVERMLHGQRYPLDHPPYDATRKTQAFKAAARQLNLDWELPKLAVTFGNDGEPPAPGRPIREPEGWENVHGDVQRLTCRLVGECDVGCNYGSKNSLDHTYLSAAKRAGADIRTLTEVRAFEPDPAGGYSVRYVVHDPDQVEEGAPPPPSTPGELRARRLILSAGALGSTYLLLRNRSALPRLGPALGTRFCGNGDLLTFAARCTEATPDGRRRPRRIDPGHGPVITSRIRVADSLDGDGGGPRERGFYLEDAGYPEHINWMLEIFDTPGLLWRARSNARRLFRQYLQRDPESDLSAEVSSLFGDSAASDSSLPLLAMGLDVPDGTMRLRGPRARLDVDWTVHTSREFFERVRGTARDVAQALGGSFDDNVIWHFGRVVTVHPLGGCPMGESVQEGVVDPWGEAHGHPGLHVADGSVMPGPVGPNPSLTIAALAERFARRIVERERSGDRG